MSGAWERRGPDPAGLNVHTYRTERFVLDLAKPEDADELYRMVGGADRDAITEHLIWDGPDELEDISAWIERSVHGTYQEFGFHWLIRDHSGSLAPQGVPLGSFGTRPSGVPGRGDVGYWLGREHWGQGVMSEVLRRFITLAFDDLDYAKIEAEVFTENARGIRLVESVGMEREGVIRRAHRKRGRWVDSAVYGVLWSE